LEGCTRILIIKYENKNKIFFWLVKNIDFSNNI
jgi:hypothetical protein